MKWECPACGISFEVSTVEEAEAAAEKYDIGPKGHEFRLPYIEQLPFHIPCKTSLRKVYCWNG